MTLPPPTTLLWPMRRHHAQSIDQVVVTAERAYLPNLVEQAMNQEQRRDPPMAEDKFSRDTFAMQWVEIMRRLLSQMLRFP